MTDIKAQIKEPFETTRNNQLTNIEEALAAYDDFQETPKKWSTPKKEIQECVLPQFNKWLQQLKKIRHPLSNKKEFYNERKRINRIKHFTLFTGRGFLMRAKIILVFLLNILKKIVIFSSIIGAAAGVLYLLYEGIMYLFGS